MKPLFLVFRGGGTPPWCQRTRIFFAISARGVRFGAEQTLSQLQMRKFSPWPQKQQKEERRGEERNVGGEGEGKKKRPDGGRRGIFLGVKGGAARERRGRRRKTSFFFFFFFLEMAFPTSSYTSSSPSLFFALGREREEA